MVLVRVCFIFICFFLRLNSSELNIQTNEMLCRIYENEESKSRKQFMKLNMHAIQRYVFFRNRLDMNGVVGTPLRPNRNGYLMRVKLLQIQELHYDFPSHCTQCSRIASISLHYQRHPLGQYVRSPTRPIYYRQLQLAHLYHARKQSLKRKRNHEKKNNEIKAKKKAPSARPTRHTLTSYRRS